MHLIMFSDFSKGSTQCKEVSYQKLLFSKHNLFSMIYLIHEQKLNTSNYPKHELIMEIFVWATDHDMNMHAKI
jgi:hypothetical protein